MESTTEKVKILSAGAISATLRRMAYEIYERNFAESKLVFSAIGPRGKFIADHLEAHLKEISPLELQRMDIHKTDGGSGLIWAEPMKWADLNGSTFVMVDDVLYSGGTLLRALVLAESLRPSQIQTAFLIDRGHHHYPVTHDYVGMEIATSLKQYISVEVDEATQRAEAFIY